MMLVRTLLALLLFTAPAFAEQSAEAFLHSIYDQYNGTDGPPLDEAAMQAYFTPETAALIKADSDAAAKKGEVPKLNGDPFIDAQDWKIEQIKIVAEEKPDTAVGTVTFLNFGQPFEIKLDLAKTPNGWRIAEIHAPSGTLRELFAR
jgi:hypothetical protein